MINGKNWQKLLLKRIIFPFWIWLIKDSLQEMLMLIINLSKFFLMRMLRYCWDSPSQKVWDFMDKELDVYQFLHKMKKNKKLSILNLKSLPEPYGLIHPFMALELLKPF